MDFVIFKTQLTWGIKMSKNKSHGIIALILLLTFVLTLIAMISTGISDENDGCEGSIIVVDDLDFEFELATSDLTVICDNGDYVLRHEGKGKDIIIDCTEGQWIIRMKND